MLMVNIAMSCVCIMEQEFQKDLKGAAHYFKLSVDQGNADGEYCYGLCLQYGTGISKDLKRAAHYFKRSADQENAKRQYQ
jgi:TPR repeat protein